MSVNEVNQTVPKTNDIQDQTDAKAGDLDKKIPEPKIELETPVIQSSAPESKGPELSDWTPKQKSFSGESIQYINALGDIHGWAPGLIVYLITNQLAKIEINKIPIYEESKPEGQNGKANLTINNASMEKIFPNPITYFEKQGKFQLSGLNNFQTEGSKSSEGRFHSIKAEWIASDKDVFIQMGDVFDRGDFSELNAEILRQLIIQAPLRVFVLVGNHEQFLIENDFPNWLLNETRFSYSSEKKDKGFHTRFHPETNNWDHLDEEKIKTEVFNRYRISCVLLFLTQYCAQVKVIPELKQKFNSIDIDSDIILGGGWGAYRYAEKFLTRIKNLKYLPGGITLLGIGHSVFVHAEPKAFSVIKVEDLKTDIQSISNASLNLLIIQYCMSQGQIEESSQFPLLWERGGSVGSTLKNPSPEATSYIPNLIKLFPGVRHYVHGHTPTGTLKYFVDLEGNFPVTYLARNYGEVLSTQIGSVRIHMIDEGFTPVYYVGSSEAIFSPVRIPIGLLTNMELLPYQGVKDELLEESPELWRKIINISNSVKFSVPPNLKLMEKTQIGILQPGMAIWSDLSPDLNYPDRRFVFDNQIQPQNFKLFRDSSKCKIPTKGISFLLYQKTTDVLSGPNKVYSLSQKINTPLDEILSEFITSNILKWLSQEKNIRPFPIIPKEEVSKWLADVYNPTRTFGPLYNLVKINGMNAFFSTPLIYGLFSIDKSGHPFAIIINTTRAAVYFKAIVGNPENSITLNAEIPSLFLNFIEAKVAFQQPVLVNWAISPLNIELTCDGSDFFIEKSSSGNLSQYISNSRTFGGLAWFKENGESLPSQKSMSVNMIDSLNLNPIEPNINGNKNGTKPDENPQIEIKGTIQEGENEYKNEPKNIIPRTFWIEKSRSEPEKINDILEKSIPKPQMKPIKSNNPPRIQGSWQEFPEKKFVLKNEKPPIVPRLPKQKIEKSIVPKLRCFDLDDLEDMDAQERRLLSYKVKISIFLGKESRPIIEESMEGQFDKEVKKGIKIATDIKKAKIREFEVVLRPIISQKQELRYKDSLFNLLLNELDSSNQSLKRIETIKFKKLNKEGYWYETENQDSIGPIRVLLSNLQVLKLDEGE